MKSIAAFVLPALVLVTGCARYQYRAAPISPDVLAQSLYARTLDDPDLRSWMSGPRVTRRPPGLWKPGTSIR
jgi:hypothetical protein